MLVGVKGSASELGEVLVLFARNGFPLRPLQVTANAVDQESQVMAVPPTGGVVEPVGTQDSFVNVFEGGLPSPSNSFVRHSVR